MGDVLGPHHQRHGAGSNESQVTERSAEVAFCVEFAVEVEGFLVHGRFLSYLMILRLLFRGCRLRADGVLLDGALSNG